MKRFDMGEFFDITLGESDYWDFDDLGKKRRYSIVKANDLIRKARLNLTVREMKVVSYIYSKIKPTDNVDSTYVFSTREFLQVCGLTLDSGNNYKPIDSLLLEIRNKGFILDTDEDAGSVSWIRDFDRVKKTGGKYKNGVYKTGDYIIYMSPKIMTLLVGLDCNFTAYKLLYTLPMTSAYSIKLYEILKSYAYLGSHTFDIDELKITLGIEDPKTKTCKYKNFKDFRLYVLDKAQEEINSFTDIKITYYPIKNGRKVVKVKFSILEKDKDSKIVAEDEAESALGDEKVIFASKRKRKKARESRKV